MKSLFHLAAEIQRFLLSQRWRFCFVGGIALQRWGDPRLTRDVDITLLTGVGGEERYVDALCGQYPSRIPDAREFALKNRVLLLESDRGIPIDIALGALPFEELAVQRATDFQFMEDVTLRTCSAEDLIVFKAFADRRRDWADIEGVLLRQGGDLDWAYIRNQLAPLCELKEAPEIMDRLEQLYRGSR